jgi:hypothetical protein
VSTADTSYVGASPPAVRRPSPCGPPGRGPGPITRPQPYTAPVRRPEAPCFPATQATYSLGRARSLARSRIGYMAPMWRPDARIGSMAPVWRHGPARRGSSTARIGPPAHGYMGQPARIGPPAHGYMGQPARIGPPAHGYMGQPARTGPAHAAAWPHGRAWHLHSNDAGLEMLTKRLRCDRSQKRLCDRAV